MQHAERKAAGIRSFLNSYIYNAEAKETEALSAKLLFIINDTKKADKQNNAR